MAPSNAKLCDAQRNKKDEFYTSMEDVDRELSHYTGFLRGKSVYLNCDDARRSKFWTWLSDRFEEIGLSRLVATCYISGGRGRKREMALSEEGRVVVEDSLLDGDGDFRSEECVAMLDGCDVVITNPPFSLFKEFVPLVVSHGKKFLVVGHQNGITYRGIFPLIRDGEVWLGFGFPGNVGYFESPYEDVAVDAHHEEGRIRVSGVLWYTNIDAGQHNGRLPLTMDYSPDDYRRYDNYDAIEAGKTVHIPRNYDGVVGVPVTYLTKHCPEQFRIVGCSHRYGDWGGHVDGTPWDCIVDGKAIYKRLFIQAV